jgi:hypothetical protein
VCVCVCAAFADLWRSTKVDFFSSCFPSELLPCFLRSSELCAPNCEEEPLFYAHWEGGRETLSKLLSAVTSGSDRQTSSSYLYPSLSVRGLAQERERAVRKWESALRNLRSYRHCSNA